MALVSSSFGPINSLLLKLPAEPEFRDLKHGLERMKNYLLRLYGQGVFVSALNSILMRHVRELAYDVEDWVDGLLMRSQGKFQLESLSSDDIDQLQEFSERITAAQDLGTTYGVLGVDHAVLASSEVTVNPEAEKPRVQLQKDGRMWMEKPPLVGLDDPKSEIIQHLIDPEEKRKVVTILGPEGLGKTTLAREVFWKLQSQFDCAAFVYVGWSPSIYATLMDIAHQVMPKSLIPSDEKMTTTQLWEFLRTKR